jgi:trans-aconitate methyltransferase
MNWDPDKYAEHTRFVSDLGMPVVALLRAVPGERVLDLGCGDGVLTRKLLEIGCEVTGVDASPEMVRAAVERGVDARVMDAHALTFEEEFDAVFSNAALHWMKQPECVVSGVRRALKAAGRFVGEFGGRGNVHRLHRALLRAVADRGIAPGEIDPWYFPSPEDYRELLEASGFEVGYIELIDRPTPLPTGVIGWIESVARPFLVAVKPDQRGALLAEVEEHVRPFLLKDGTWYADYVRLRFSAAKCR